MKKQAIAVLALLAGLAAVSLGLTALTFTPNETADALAITATTYPMYTAVLQVVGDTKGVSVSCLTAPTVGCVHEYQLSPSEMATLRDTDILVMNGGGAEQFLQQALAAVPSLTCIDTSVGIELLCAEHTHHHDHDHHGENEHLWVSPTRYARQVQTLRDRLCALDPSRAPQYTENAERYLSAINAIQQEWNTLTLPTDKAVLFHDSVAYAAEALGLTPLATLPIGEDAGIATGDLTAAADAVKGQTVVLLFDGQYPPDTLSLDTYADRAITVVWDTAVRPRDGVADRDTWLAAMHDNGERLKAVIR